MVANDAQPKVHALHIPELLNIIRESIDDNDWLSLMKTCRAIFSIIASSIWSEVEAQVLLDLIVEKPQLAAGSESLDAGTASGVDFSRFDTYAPFVRQLRVYGRTARYFKGERRRMCLVRAQQEPLLSRLASVTMMTNDLYHDSDALFWLDLFLGPSLRELRVTPITKSYSAWISFPATCALLDRLATTCPNIEKLEFYPLDITRRSGRHSDNSTGMLWPIVSRPNLGTFTQLRRITTSIGILDDRGLATLGVLPRLQSLTINGCGESPIDLQLDVSDDSFPALTQLHLLDIDTTNLKTIMQVKQLAQGLTSLRLSQAFSLAETNFEYCEGWLSQTIPSLLEHTSQLKKFTYTAVKMFGSLPGRYSVYRIDYMPLLQALSKNPLQQVSLLGLCFIDDDYLKHLPTAFPLLSVLRLSLQPVFENDLWRFAKLPRLRHLLLHTIILREIPRSLPKFQNSLETIESSFELYSGCPEPSQVAR
ncbi:hypothetical protein FRC12_010820 [Ceratobasidium sp. 428]|nr:hypothetical protein FRC12_010820 [Ceratobasidium sp. 428]